MINDETADREYEELKNNKFKQQKLPAWRPVPTITSTSLTFFFFGIAFIIVGVIILIYSNQIVEVSQNYDLLCHVNTVCEVKFSVPETMEPPIMFYYQLNNFYQNHRRYVKSKSSSQLKGDIYTLAELKSSKDCDPIYSMEDLGLNRLEQYVQNKSLFPANPCGLIAKSFFNDTYELKNLDGKNIHIDENNIAWEADKELKYARAQDPTGKDPDYWKKVQWIDVLDEHFMVWMRPAGLPNFRKLWGRINETLNNGTYVMKINNTYDVVPFKGQKFFVLSTINSFGGRNNFLGISYIVVGCICICMAIAFIVGYKLHNQKKDN